MSKRTISQGKHLGNEYALIAGSVTKYLQSADTPADEVKADWRKPALRAANTGKRVFRRGAELDAPIGLIALRVKNKWP